MVTGEIHDVLPLKEAAMDPVLDPAPPATKPSYKSMEAWISLVLAILGAVMASGLLDPSDPFCLGIRP